jgi:hypothetical protein
MDDEYNSLLELGTWTLVKTPPNITPIPVKRQLLQVQQQATVADQSGAPEVSIADTLTTP